MALVEISNVHKSFGEVEVLRGIDLTVEKGEIVVPNVGSKLPLAELHAELHHLAALYAAMRRVRGDGNCFYRALWMGWMERLCALPLAEREAVWLRLVPRLKTELEGGVPEKRRAEWAALSDGFATTTEKLCAGGYWKNARFTQVCSACLMRNLVR